MVHPVISIVRMTAFENSPIPTVSSVIFLESSLHVLGASLLGNQAWEALLTTATAAILTTATVLQKHVVLVVILNDHYLHFR